MENKKSFILYADLLKLVEKLPEDLAGRLFLTILLYVNDLNPEPEDLLLQIAFEPIKQQLKRDLKKWEVFHIKQIENGKRGGRPKNPTDNNESQKTQAFLEKPKKAVSVNANVNVTANVNPNINKIESAKTILKTELEPFIEKYGVTMCQAFFDYWSESNSTKTKCKYQLQETWETSRRLATWYRRSNKE
jgi:hypothetical protein